MKRLHTTIPVQLCEYVLLNGKSNHFALYLYLKHNSDGYIGFDSSQYKHWAVDLNKSERWIRSAMKWLIKNKWITVNSNRKVLNIISYKNLCRKLKIYATSGAIYEQEDFSDLKGFLCAVVIIYHLRKKRWMEKKGWSVFKMGYAKTNHLIFPKGFHSMPISYIAKCLEVSQSTANNFKKAAEKSGYIDVKRQITTLTDDKGEKISKDLLYLIRKTNPQFGKRLRVGKKYLKLVESDLIKPEVKLKRKRL